MLYSKTTAWAPYRQNKKGIFWPSSKFFKMDGMDMGLTPVPTGDKKAQELTDEERILIAAILRILR
jgi:hypothetical protein